MHCVDLDESYPNSNAYLLAKFGFDTAENEPCKVCPLSAYRSPDYRSPRWEELPAEQAAREEAEKITRLAKAASAASPRSVALLCAGVGSVSLRLDTI